MADSKISALTNYTTPASTDVLAIVDIGGGTVTKKITWGNLFTSPTLITPALGTPVSGVMTNVTGLPTAGLVNNAVTNAKAAQMATKTYKGRTSALTGDAEDVAVATLKTDLVLVKGDVGLGSVDNTTDAGKPVSTAQQTALDLKANLASPTFTGTVVLPNSQILTTPVFTGLPTGTGVASAATVSTLVARDANANISADSVLQGYTTTVTAAGTTTLTVDSTYLQFFTGSTTQTLTLPVATTLVLGQQFYIRNNSTGAVTINSSGANVVRILAGNTRAIATCILASGTTAASWSVMYVGISITDGKILTASNTLTLAGTDATTMTFPTTSATIARTDAAQTFTGVQTFVAPILGTPTSVTLTNATGLPIAGLVNSTSAALGLGTIELGHATDTTIARSSAGVATIEGVRIDTVATTTEVSNATPAPAITATRHTHTITALAAAATFGVPTSSIALTDDNTLLIRIKDNATARALVWNAIFRASSDLALPSTTVVSKTLYLGFKYNVADTKWDLLSLLNNI